MAAADSPVGAVLVIGGGIAGMQASLDMADSGFRVYLMDSSPTIGGAMSQLDKTFPTNDCSMCIMAPKLVETGRHHNIELITNAELEKLEGGPGNFNVTLKKRARKVDESKCTGCGICTQRCPVEVPDEYNRGFKSRKAIYVKYPQAVPPTHSIDLEQCIGCGICETQCEAGAIIYSQEEEEITLNIGSVIISPGFEEFDLSATRTEYGYGEYPNVVSSLEFERMLSATGPYGGKVFRPSDAEIPDNVAFIQCVGSRDKSIGNPYCSSVCCMFAIKEAVIAKEHMPGLKPHIFFMDMRAFGKEFDDYYNRAQAEHGIKFFRNNRIAGILEIAENNNLIVTYIDEGELRSREFDLVVLSVAMDSARNAKILAEKLGVTINDYNFCDTEIFTPIETDRPGIFVCGAFQSPKDIPDSVSQASGAAGKATSIIADGRNTLVTVKEFPPEKEIKEGEEPRIGLFVCHCGINIGGVVNVSEVAEYAKTLPNIVTVDENLYTCSQDTQEKIKKVIDEQNLNRVIVASCTPRTHGPLFQNTIREAGLNKYVFEMANIRDQCSWVHSEDPESATEKAKDLVRMAAAKSALLKPLPKIETEITPVGLVIGGGITGMTSALELANQGYEAIIVEKTEMLGGLTQRLHFGLKGENIQEYMNNLIEKVETHKKIRIYKNTQIKDEKGYIGNFKTTIEQSGKEIELEHGITIVATGGEELKTNEYMHGQNESVVTQLDFDNMLYSGEISKPVSAVMIQCVGCRNKDRPYCSRVCCTEALKNARKLLEIQPESTVYILFKDMRTYGFRELYYEKAAAEGVIFVRYDDQNPPRVSSKDGLTVEVYDHFINENIKLNPDYLVLSLATVPAEDNAKLAKVLKVPLSKDGFFLEAHMKLRPNEFATDGIFLAGLAHAPKFINECIYQAQAATSRAVTILSKEKIEAEAIVSIIDQDKCSGCGTCITICPYQAVEKNGDGKAEPLSVLCKGCGICAASCPEKAIDIANFTDLQILSQGIAALSEGGSSWTS
jgi:heterodisulfide reductase subunit A